MRPPSRAPPPQGPRAARPGIGPAPAAHAKRPLPASHRPRKRRRPTDQRLHQAPTSARAALATRSTPSTRSNAAQSRTHLDANHADGAPACAATKASPGCKPASTAHHLNSSAQTRSGRESSASTRRCWRHRAPRPSGRAVRANIGSHHGHASDRTIAARGRPNQPFQLQLVLATRHETTASTFAQSHPGSYRTTP